MCTSRLGGGPLARAARPQPARSLRSRRRASLGGRLRHSPPPPCALPGRGLGRGFPEPPPPLAPAGYALPSALCFCRFHALVSSGLLGRAPPFLSGVFGWGPRPSLKRGRGPPPLPALPPCRPCSRPPVRCLLGSGYGESGVRLRRAFFSAAATIDDDNPREPPSMAAHALSCAFSFFLTKIPDACIGDLFLPYGQKKSFL